MIRKPYTNAEIAAMETPLERAKAYGELADYWGDVQRVLLTVAIGFGVLSVVLHLI